MWKTTTTILAILFPFLIFGDPLVDPEETVRAIEIEAFDLHDRFLDGLRVEQNGELYDIDFFETKQNSNGSKEESFSYRLMTSSADHFSSLARITKNEKVGVKYDHLAFDESSTFKIQIYTEKGKIVIYESFKDLQPNAKKLTIEAMKLLQND